MPITVSFEVTSLTDQELLGLRLLLESVKDQRGSRLSSDLLKAQAPEPQAAVVDERQAEMKFNVLAVTEEPEEVSKTYVDGEVDANGFPWDERIHASSKAKTADGSWRQRRGVDPAVLQTVTAQLKARIVAAVPAAPAVPPPPPPPPPPLPISAPAYQEITLAYVVPRITAAMSRGEFNQDKLAETCRAVGLPNGLLSLHDNIDKAPALLEALGV